MAANHLLALVVEASPGLGYQLALSCARRGFDLVVTTPAGADEANLAALRKEGNDLDVVYADVATPEGVDSILDRVRERTIGALLINMSPISSHPFFDHTFANDRHLMDLHIVGVLDLIQRVGHQMRKQGHGHILLTAPARVERDDACPGHAVQSGTRAFMDAFAVGLRQELRDTGVTVTRLLAGISSVEFFGPHGAVEGVFWPQDNRLDLPQIAESAVNAMLSGTSHFIVTGMNPGSDHDDRPGRASMAESHGV